MRRISLAAIIAASFFVCVLARAQTSVLFTSSGSWSVPTGVTAAVIDACGAGGPGAGGQNTVSTAGGGAGGSAQCVKRFPISLTGASSLTISIPTAPSGGAAGSAGTAAANTTITGFDGGGTITLIAGKAGAAGASGTGGAGGAGGGQGGGAGGTAGGGAGTAPGVSYDPYQFPGAGGGGGGSTATGGGFSAAINGNVFSGKVSPGSGNGSGGGGASSVFGIGVAGANPGASCSGTPGYGAGGGGGGYQGAGCGGGASFVVITYGLVASGGSGTVTSVAVSGGTTGLTTSGGPITTSGTITLGGTLGTGSGGTGAASLAAANIPTVTGSWTTGDCVGVQSAIGPVFDDIACSGGSVSGVSNGWLTATDSAYGAKGDLTTVSGCSITSASAALTCTGASFTSGDVGKSFWMNVAGSSRAILAGTISSFTNSTHVTLSTNAGTTVSSTSFKYLTTPRVSAGGTGYVPGDTSTATGGTETANAVVTIESTKVVSAAVKTAGSGGTNGTCLVQGTTGTVSNGTGYFLANVTIASGAISAVNFIDYASDYTTNPTGTVTAGLIAEPVANFNGCGSLSGAVLNVGMGAATLFQTDPGDYSVLPSSPVAQGSTSGSGSGLTYSFVSQNSGTFNYGTDNTSAFNSIISTINSQPTTPVSVWLPAGNYLVNGSGLTLMTKGAPWFGAGMRSTNIFIGPSYSGADLFSCSTCWMGNALLGPTYIASMGGLNFGLIDMQIQSSLDFSNQVNAVDLYDQDDFTLLQNVAFSFINGACLRMGYTKNQTKAYARESFASNVHCWFAGSASQAAMEWNTEGTGDSSNEWHSTNINVFEPATVGLLFHDTSNTTKGPGSMSFDQTRVEGAQAGDLIMMGLVGSDTGKSAGSTWFNNLLGNGSAAGYAMFRLIAPSTTSRPNLVHVQGSIQSGSGFGIVVDAGLDDDFHIRNMGSSGTNIVVANGSLVGSNILLDGYGAEESWSKSIDSSASTDVIHPSTTTY